MIVAGLEPAVFGSEVQRFIHGFIRLAELDISTSKVNWNAVTDNKYEDIALLFIAKQCNK